MRKKVQKENLKIFKNDSESYLKNFEESHRGWVEAGSDNV